MNRNRGSRIPHFPWKWILASLACVVMALPSSSLAGWSLLKEDTAKPKPEFSREGEAIQAKLIPRGKLVSILIDFKASGGELLSVEGKDFDEVDRPEVDKKDFRSALFVIRVGNVSPGGEASLSIASDYFNNSTEFWSFNEKAPTPWTGVEVKHKDLPDRVNELTVALKDGGPLDLDGQANGEIVVIAGPKDPFWGFAIGTLLIRFFGVLLVLVVLMIGMKVASSIFRKIEGSVAAAEPEARPAVAAAAVAPKPAVAPPPMDPDTASAVAVALHLHFLYKRK